MDWTNGEQYPACALPVGFANAERDAEFVRDVEYVPAC